MSIISKTNDLEILLAVCDTGSFSGAAKSLDCPVAKVTRAIQRLESELSCNLFNRTTRRVEATEEGKVFIEHIRPGLIQLEKAEENLRLLQSAPSGLLRVDAASPFIIHQLVPLMAGFREAFPLIKIELISSDNIINLIEKRTDVAIRIGQLQDSNLHAIALGKSKLRLVASPSYLQSHGYPEQIDHLQEHKTLGFSENSKLNDLPLLHNVTIKPEIAASSGETMLKLCLLGNGIALLSDFMTKPLLKNGRLIEVLPGSVVSPHPREDVWAVYYRNTALSSRISAFIGYIAERLDL